MAKEIELTVDKYGNLPESQGAQMVREVVAKMDAQRKKDVAECLKH